MKQLNAPLSVGLEGFLATAFVMLVIGALSAIATIRHSQSADRPIHAINGGKIILLGTKAILTGSLEHDSFEFESQTTDFSYTHGRKVRKERQERKIKNWTSTNAAAKWTFITPITSEYIVYLHYASEGHVEGSLQLTHNQTELKWKHRPTGTLRAFKKFRIGTIHCEANIPQALTLHTTAPHADDWIRIAKIELTPKNP